MKRPNKVIVCLFSVIGVFMLISIGCSSIQEYKEIDYDNDGKIDIRTNYKNGEIVTVEVFTHNESTFSKKTYFWNSDDSLNKIVYTPGSKSDLKKRVRLFDRKWQETIGDQIYWVHESDVRKTYDNVTQHVIGNSWFYTQGRVVRILKKTGQGEAIESYTFFGSDWQKYKSILLPINRSGFLS